jgi:hypothetical protein
LNKYTELKSKQQKEVDAFPFGFAFNKDQYDIMMDKWGLKPTHRSQIIYIGGGSFVRKSDYKAMHEMFALHEAEHKAAMKDDEYLYQMFNYELGNHEYGYTQDLTDTLEALGLTIDEINADPRMADALKRAIAAQED